MNRAFMFCVTPVLGIEGGESDHPLDPGGHTNLGITQATLDRAHALIPGLPANVSDLTTLQALQIYEVMYWRVVRGDDLPLPLALLAFDAAVNQGEGVGVRCLQHAVGVAADGAIGPRTLAAARRVDLPTAIAELAARRMHAYMLLDRLDDTFGLGWSRRLVRVLLAAHKSVGVVL